MMVTNTYRVGGRVVFIFLIWASVCYCQDTKAEATDSMNPVATRIATDDRAKKTPSDEQIGFFDTSRLVEKIVNELHYIVREEHSAAFSEIDKELQETLAYLAQERRTTMIDLASIGDRIVENGLLKSERLIDHFFVRALQVATVVILAVCILGFFFSRTIMRRKNQP